MREVELKAHAGMALKESIDSFAGCMGSEVDKLDLYFRKPGENVQALRVRINNGKMELTAKEQHSGEKGENNLEYELFLSASQRDDAIAFFKCLGFEEYFIKHKKGYSWHYGDLHIELLDVNDIGSFMEIEALLDYDADEMEIEKAQQDIMDVLRHFNLESAIERTSYREMILNGIQGKPYTC